MYFIDSVPLRSEYMKKNTEKKIIFPNLKWTFYHLKVLRKIWEKFEDFEITAATSIRSISSIRHKWKHVSII